jgi:hypothetical protein
MTLWALVQDGVVGEITDVDPAGRFTPAWTWYVCGTDVRQGWTYAGGVFSAPDTPGPSLDEQAQASFDAYSALGIVITCTGNAALSATYAIDPTTMNEVGSVARDAASGLGLPGGGSTFTYPDATGTPRTFTSTQLIALYKAQRDLLFILNTQAAVMRNGGAPAWPVQTATIP